MILAWQALALRVDRGWSPRPRRGEGGAEEGGAGGPCSLAGGAGEGGPSRLTASSLLDALTEW